MSVLLFSQHSSNPLEAGSSDVRRRYSKSLRALDNPASSDDPLAGFHIPEVKEYHQHLTSIRPDYSIPSRLRADQGDDTMAVDDDDDDEQGAQNESEEDGEGEGDDEEMIFPDESDEEFSILKKSSQERQEIEQEIMELETALPELCEDYKLVDRLGTGTFSSVYKAIDLGFHDKWDNTLWLGSDPDAPSRSKVFVAVKRIYVTSNPERIRNEIAILADCRSCRYVSQLITAFRHQDQVVAIMPYHCNDDFREYHRTLPMAGIKMYFRCLFRALRDIHARKIIHRDVKPANFLFDPRTGQGVLCDFGLACRLDAGPKQAIGACLHGPATDEHPHGHALPRDSKYQNMRLLQSQAKAKSLLTASEKVGYPANETRPHSKANRAGTRGFRAPEVLFKCGEQTGAIDVWSSGIILLFFLTGKFPIFQCADDNEALLEMATILGKKKMEKAALLHNRAFYTNVPTVTEQGVPWSDFVTKLNPGLYEPQSQDARDFPYSSVPPVSSSPSRTTPSSPGSETYNPSVEDHKRDVDLAFSFLQGLLEPEATKRITSKDALAHDFLRDGEEPDDDEMFPHPFGQGICSQHHGVDAVTEDPVVKLCKPGTKTWTTRNLQPGQGIAIGRQPCEFHTDIELYD